MKKSISLSISEKDINRIHSIDCIGQESLQFDINICYS